MERRQGVSEEKIRTTREESRSVACPVCGAATGEACRRDDAPSHAARHEAAVAAGAPRVDRGATQGVAPAGP